MHTVKEELVVVVCVHRKKMLVYKYLHKKCGFSSLQTKGACASVSLNRIVLPILRLQFQLNVECLNIRFIDQVD